MKIFKNIWNLLKYGFVKKEERSFKKSLVFILKMFLILMIFKIFSIGLIELLDYLGIIEKPINVSLNKIEEFTKLQQFLIIVLYVPIIEELAFRIGLKYSKLNLTLMSMALSLTILTSWLKIDWLYSIIIALSIGILSTLVLQKENVSEYLKKYWTNNRRFILYALLLTFGYLHLTNYAITLELILISPIVILPRILGGLVYSYVRLESGIILAILLHCLNNGLGFLMNL